MTAVLVTMPDAEALRGHLDRLNDAGLKSETVGMGANGESFLVVLSGPYADREEVFFGSPWDAETDWSTGLRCDECCTHEAFALDDIAFPAVILAVNES